MDEEAEIALTVRLAPHEIAAIDDWIARAPEPRPGREEAVRQLVAGRLGTHGPGTVLPDLVTGRDIV